MYYFWAIDEGSRKKSSSLNVRAIKRGGGVITIFVKKKGYFSPKKLGEEKKMVKICFWLFSSVTDPDPGLDPDPVGSASGNVDLDPGTKKNRDELAYKSTKIIKR